MSQENVEIVRGVRTPLSVATENRRRTLDERIFVLLPALARIVLSAWSRLPPRSRLRRVLLRRFFRQGYEAVNRRDFDVLFLALDPGIELRVNDSPVAPPDMLGVHHGYEDYRRLWEAADEVWEDMRLLPEEVIDFGDRMVTAARYVGRGRTSGVPINQSLFQAYVLRRGLVFRQEDFTDREKALEAVGLSE